MNPAKSAPHPTPAPNASKLAKKGPPPPGAAPGGGGGRGAPAAPLARGSGAGASAGGEGVLCVACKEPSGGGKFCLKCGQVQPGAHETKIVKPAATVSGGKGAYHLDVDKLLTQFTELCKQDSSAHMQTFLKSFIFPLGDDWKMVLNLQKEFEKMLRDEGESSTQLNEVQAMTFLQRHGAERTTIQRREEVRDIDLDKDQRITFIEYLLLHFKTMILGEFYKRLNIAPEEDLSKGGVGITGVGAKLLDQLFNGVGHGTLPPDLEKAIEEFTLKIRERNEKLRKLQEQSKGASVKAMAAANEIKQMENEDMTEMNRIEITLNAAKKRALKGNDGEKALEEKRKAELKAEEEKRRLSRASLKEKAAAFDKKE